MRNFLLVDFVTKMNNAKRWYYKAVVIENSNINREILKLFLQIGIIRGYTIEDPRFIEVWLKRRNGRCVFRKIRVVSIPSKPVYVDLVKLGKLKDKSNTSFFIVSTSIGLLYDFQCIYNNISGKVILKIDL